MYSCIQGILGIGTHLQTSFSFVAVTIASTTRTAAVCTASEARKLGESVNRLRICCNSLQRFATQLELLKMLALLHPHTIVHFCCYVLLCQSTQCTCKGRCLFLICYWCAPYFKCRRSTRGNMDSYWSMLVENDK